MIQRLSPLLVIPLSVWLAETGRLNWVVALPVIFVALLVTIFLPRIKGVKVTGAEIELFERQAAEISKAQIDAIKTEAAAQKEALEKLIKTAAQSEKRLEQLTKQVGPRELVNEAFLKALEGNPKGHVEIMFVGDDPDSFRISLQIRSLLRKAGWVAEEPVPIPATDGRLPPAMAVGGQPSGITIVTATLSQSELNAMLTPWAEHPEVTTPFITLCKALRDSLGEYKTGAARLGPALGRLRIVIAPKS